MGRTLSPRAPSVNWYLTLLVPVKGLRGDRWCHSLALMKPRVKPRAAVIEALRKANHLSTSELARRAGTSRQYMSRIQLGSRGASADVLERIAKALSVTPEMIADPVITADAVVAEVLATRQLVSEASSR